MQRCQQFITGDYKPVQAYLPDKEYGLALDCLTKAVSDILVVSHDGGKILLGKRKVEPQPDWWMIGGRAKCGETTKQAAARNLKRELGLDLEAERFKVIASYSFLWYRRDQPPQENGTADISTVHVVEVTEEESKSIKFDGKEYETVDWVSQENILVDKDSCFHPALKQSIKDWSSVMQYEKLVKFCNHPDADDATIASIARAMVSCRNPVDEVTQVLFKENKYEYVQGKNPCANN